MGFKRIRTSCQQTPVGSYHEAAHCSSMCYYLQLSKSEHMLQQCYVVSQNLQAEIETTLGISLQRLYWHIVG
jgi:hypothetical protein